MNLALSAVIAGPGALIVRRRPGRAPGAGELLIAPDVVGVCGTDLELLDGSMGYLTNGSAGYPIVPGHEWTGVVHAIGPGVTGFTEGDRVVGECSVGCGDCATCGSGAYHLCPDRTETGILNRTGGLTTALIFPAVSAHRVPPGVDPLDAALIEPLAVAYRGLHRLSPAPSGPLAIIGAGAIGLLCALAARALGMGPVLLVERAGARRSFAADLGFGTAVRTSETFGQVVDATGTPSGLGTALRMTADGGRVAALGLCGRKGVPLDLDDLVLRDITLAGSLGSPGVWPDVIELVAAGRITPSRIVSHEFSLDGAAAAFALASSGDPATRKVVIRPQRTGRLA